MDLSINKIGDESAETLLRISREAFFTAFAHLNKPEDMDEYSAKAFTMERISEELNNPYSFFYFAYIQDNIAGYIKLNYNNAQTELQEPEALKVERIYVLQGFQNSGIGQRLLQFVIDTAIHQQLNYIWLGVWEHNTNAIRFYERNNFRVFGRHDFMLGSDKQTDLLMKRMLP